MRVVGTGMTILFAVWAYYQLNDIDPVLWVTIYIVAAFLSLMGVFTKMSPGIPLAAGGASLFGALFLLVQVEFGQPLITIEEWREAIGLLVISAWMAVLFLFHRSMRPADLPTDEQVRGA